jgi:hypothetical protein
VVLLDLPEGRGMLRPYQILLFPVLRVAKLTKNWYNGIQFCVSFFVQGSGSRSSGVRSWRFCRQLVRS